MSIIGNPIMAGVSVPAASIFVTGLSETDIVTATKGGKTLTGKWKSDPNPEFVSLPSGYTQLEYIESTGTQYINTGIILKKNYIVDLKSNISDANSNIWLFGSDNFNAPRFGIQADVSGSTLQAHAIFCADDWTDYASIRTNQLLNIRYSLENTQKFLIDDVLYGTKSNTISDAALPLYLFADNQRGSAISLAKMKCYRFTVSLSGSAAINDFIPAKRNSDGVVGMYDLVSNAFFENSGTGTFVAGAEIPQTIDGFLIKPIRDFGTWTVTATDGEKTATQDVLVDVITNYEIEMDLTKLWLYRDGDEFEDVTGGWVDDTPNGGWTSVPHIKNEDNLELSKGGSTSSYPECCVFCSNAVDITNYATLHMVVDYKLVNSGTDGVWFGLNSTHPVFLPDNTDYMFKSWDVADETSKEFTFDITSLSGLYYLQAAIIRGAILRIRKAWLE